MANKVKVCSKVAGLKVYSNRPGFHYFFHKKNHHRNVWQEDAEKILRNHTFYLDDESDPDD